jgi:hypothetical protein
MNEQTTKQPNNQGELIMQEEQVVDPEVMTDTSAIVKRSPIPNTLAELAALKGEALEVIEARIQVLETLRKAAIRATSPEDWLLFKAKDNSEIGYLQDCGADRVRDLYGIEIFNVSAPEKVAGVEPGQFHYIISGSGRCKLTRQTVENMEGGRSSTDDFCKDKKGAQQELDVRKAARANLDGNITRELAGLKNVPLQELVTAWSGSNKKVANCHRGRGYGAGVERQAAVVHEGDKTDDPGPSCPTCGAKMYFRAAGKTTTGKEYGAFWGCSNFKKTGCKGSVQQSDYLQSQQFSYGSDPDPMMGREPGMEG